MKKNKYQMYKKKEKKLLCPVIKGNVFMSKKTQTIRNERGDDYEFPIDYSCSGSSECQQIKNCSFLNNFLNSKK